MMNQQKKRSFKQLFDYELSRKFRSKLDFYTYLNENLQYYMPPISNINKDFLRSVFKDEKGVFKNQEIRKITVPRYEEISVLALMEVMKEDADFMRYFPDKMAKGRQIDRTFFFNVFNTLYPERLARYIDHARMQRNGAQGEEMKNEMIEISPEWVEQLNSIPFQSKERGRTVFLLKQKAKPQASVKKRRKIDLLDMSAAEFTMQVDSGKQQNLTLPNGTKKIIPVMIPDKGE